MTKEQIKIRLQVVDALYESCEFIDTGGVWESMLGGWRDIARFYISFCVADDRNGFWKAEIAPLLAKLQPVDD